MYWIRVFGSTVPPFTSAIGSVTVFSVLLPPFIVSKLQELPNASIGLEI